MSDGDGDYLLVGKLWLRMAVWRGGWQEVVSSAAVPLWVLLVVLVAQRKMSKIGDHSKGIFC